MPYSNILQKLKTGTWALPTCNTFDIEMTMAILDAAESERSPIVLEISKRSLEHAGGKKFLEAIRSYANDVQVPVALHYDHGEKAEEIRQAFSDGFSSAMVAYDIKKSLKANIKRTKQLVAYAKKRPNKSIQGEVGHVTGPKDNWHLPSNWLTDPEAAMEYVAETGVTTLSVSVGNRHGIASGSVQLNWELIDRITKHVDIPLVLHGGSGLRSPNYKRAVRAGISILNFDTDLRFAFGKKLGRSLVTQRDLLDPRTGIQQARQAVTQVVRKKIQLLGSKGKA